MSKQLSKTFSKASCELPVITCIYSNVSDETAFVTIINTENKIYQCVHIFPKRSEYQHVRINTYIHMYIPPAVPNWPIKTNSCRLSPWVPSKSVMISLSAPGGHSSRGKSAHHLPSVASSRYWPVYDNDNYGDDDNDHDYVYDMYFFSSIFLFFALNFYCRVLHASILKNPTATI